MKPRKSPVTKFAVCVNNRGYSASLERYKIYRVLPDADAEKDGDVRVIDESGGDYLYSATRFVKVELPQALRSSIMRAA